MASAFEETFTGIVNVRPGRELFVRKVRIGRGESCHTETAPAKKILQVVFVHGTCATQAQYEYLLASVAKMSQSESKYSGIQLDCLLYDLLACGQSPMSRRYSDYARSETCQDLQALLAAHTDPNLPILFIGHSYGPTIFLYLDSKSLANVLGYVFIGSAVRTPSFSRQDGGHQIFVLPLFILRCLQKSLNKAFVKQAVHPDNIEIQQLSLDECFHNDMFMAKAYHTQSRWTTPEQAVKVIKNKPCLVIHGADDGIISITAAQELANLLKTPLHDVAMASHLVMMEQPDKVASLILDFIVDKCIT
ncbi:hypothetical protein MPSEU_000660700 [Mayamaea pseudoterrestris]|nr:hypothetical protein MPSEU_000660700 [Mayamaea pseudoterrestris]